MTPTPPAAMTKARVAVFGCFAVNGLVAGAWAASLPSIDRRLDLGEARLGTALLVIAGSAIVVMFFAGRLCDRHSSRTMVRRCGPISAVLLTAPALAPDYPTLLAGAAVFGLGIGLTLVSLNVHSVELERRYQRPIVASFHALWSLGGAAAGGFTVLGLSLSLDSQTMLVGAAAVAAALYVYFGRALLPPPPVLTTATDSQGDNRGLGVALLTAVAALAFASHLAEAGAMDWANVHASRTLNADPRLAPLSYTVFSVAMTAVRLLGDPIRARLGPVRTLAAAGGVAVCGYCLVLVSAFAGGLPAAWLGWAGAGVGLAVVVPVLYSSIGSAGGSGKAVAAVSASGSAGLLVGPATIGFVAEASSLSVGLIIPAVMALTIALAGPTVLRRLLAAHGMSRLATAAPDRGETDDAAGARRTADSASETGSGRGSTR